MQRRNAGLAPELFDKGGHAALEGLSKFADIQAVFAQAVVHRQADVDDCDRGPSKRVTRRQHGYELPSSNANCHLIRPQWVHARSNLGKKIALQNEGL